MGNAYDIPKGYKEEQYRRRKQKLNGVSRMPPATAEEIKEAIEDNRLRRPRSNGVKRRRKIYS